MIAAHPPQMGMPAAAVTATKLIHNFHPKYLAMVGITAGIRSKVNLGDILIADPSWDWGTGKRVAVKNGYAIEPETLEERLHPSIVAMFQDVILDPNLLEDIWNAWLKEKPQSIPKLHVGPCASGSYVLADGVTIEDIRAQQNRKLLGVDMEAYGFMHAAINSIEPIPKAFSMKTVSDFADKTKETTYKNNLQEYADFISAALLKRIALKYF